MKIIKIFTICLSIILILSHNVYALGDIFDIGDAWIDLGKEEANHTMSSGSIRELSNSLYNFLLAIAIVVALAVGAIMGIQFMTAGVNKRVQVKESLIPYLISCAVVFGAFGIWKLVVIVMEQI